MIEYEKDNKDRIPFEHYKAIYKTKDPLEISKRLDIPYDEDLKVFTIRLMGDEYRIGFPDFAVEHVQKESPAYYILEELVPAKTLIIRYLIQGNFCKSQGTYVAYRDTPWGEVYFRNFNGRCIKRLAYAYGNKIEKFIEVMNVIGAKKLEYGDCSYEFEFLNGFHMIMILWSGDEEFPPSSQILFEDNFPSAFQAEDMAYVGDVSISSLKEIEKRL